MKKIFTLYSILFFLASTGLIAQDGLFISEVADPGDEFSGRFIELYNAGATEVDFSTTVMFLSRQSNGGTTWGDVQLAGTVAAGETFVIGRTEFQSHYGFAPDQESGILSGNGDDAYFLYSGGDHTTGVLYDIYGAIDTDGTGEPWEYLDSRAVRVGGITSPNTTWTASEWDIAPANVADFNPGVHDTSADTEAPVWDPTYPMADKIKDVEFNLVAKLDETSTVYYVVLADGATAPTVEEVKAGTGSAGAAAVVAGSFVAGTSETSETITGLVVETSYDVYVVAEDDEDTPNVQSVVSLVEVTTVVVPDLLFLVDFETDLAPFTGFSAAGATKEWRQTNGYAEMNGFNSGEAEVDWLISPAYDLSTATSPSMVFDAAWRFGIVDETHHLKLLYSADYDGNTANIGTATWTEIAFDIPVDDDTWTEIGPLDLSAITGTVYFAFAYDYPDNYRRWRIDNFQLYGFPAAGTDATLSDLLVDGTTVEGFEAAKTSYTVELAAGVSVVPTVTYATTDENATAAVVPATDLAGDEAARTTTVTVTAQDATTTLEYTITFNPILEIATVADLRAAVDESRKYKMTGELVLTYQQSFRNKKYVQDATGGFEIDDNDGVITTTYAVADGITGLEGTVAFFRNNLQFTPSADPGAATSTGNAIEAVVATPAQIKADRDMYQGRVVKVENVSIPDADGSAVFANGTSYDIIAAGPDTLVMRTEFWNTTLTGTVIPDSANVSGIVINYFETSQIAPRVLEDVEELVKYVPSNDATLSALGYNDQSVDGFSPALLSYSATLEAGTTAIPVITYETTDENAGVTVTDVADLGGDEAARTATILVTAEDGVTTKTYTIVFTVAVGISNDLFKNVVLYPVPATEVLYVDQASEVESLTVYSITGKAVMQLENNGETVISLELDTLEDGVYMLKLESNEGSAVTRFVKQ